MDNDQVSSVSVRKDRDEHNPTLKKVLDKQKADKIKLTVKKFLKKIDTEGLGVVKFEVFSNLLGLHQIRVAPKCLTKLRLASRAKPKIGSGDVSDQIDYKVALRLLDINLDVDEPLSKEWIIKAQGNTALSTDSYSNINTSVFSRAAGESRFQTHQQMKVINRSIPTNRTPLKVTDTANEEPTLPTGNPYKNGPIPPELTVCDSPSLKQNVTPQR